MSARGRLRYAFAVMTIVPVGARIEKEAAEGLFTCVRYLPLVGILIGMLSGGVFALASLLWIGLLPALLGVITSIVVTGALHEDGLADTADGFGGGWTRTQRLLIMKDSRLGTYGVLALGLGVALRVFALNGLPPSMALFALIAVHAAARFATVVVLTMQDYVGDPFTAKTTYGPARLPMSEMRYAFLWTLLAMFPILFMQPLAVLAGVVLGGALSLASVLYSRKAIGGYCGDVLGAIEQLFEIGCLLGVAGGSIGTVS
jgi:adenosylcobinamide-GDP ribazoletransferase